MRRHVRGCAATLVLCCAAMPAIAANPALKRVVLSSGGVGYFEYEAPVEGDATVTLDVPLDQVDDVLKSLVDLRFRRHAPAKSRCPGASRWRRALPTCRSIRRR